MPVFNVSDSQSRISANLTKIVNQANRADTHFWNGAIREYGSIGSISADPISAAKDICAALDSVVNEVLKEFSLITGHAYSAIDWTSTPYSDKHSSYMTSWTTVVAYINDIVSDAMGLYTDSAGLLDAMTDNATALEHMYHQVDAWLKLFGANFPAVFTPFYPDASIVALKCEGKSGQLELTALESDLTTPHDWDAGATWDELAVGDTIYIEHLDGTEFLAFAAYESHSYVVEHVNDSAGVLVLTAPGGGVIAGVTASAVAELPGELFVLRKVHAA